MCKLPADSANSASRTDGEKIALPFSVLVCFLYFVYTEKITFQYLARPLDSQKREEKIASKKICACARQLLPWVRGNDERLSCEDAFEVIVWWLCFYSRSSRSPFSRVAKWKYKIYAETKERRTMAALRSCFVFRLILAFEFVVWRRGD